MPGQLNVGGSVVKREVRDTQEVINKLSQDGWNKTGSRGDVVTYMEKSGINLTVVDGPVGTLIFPSGPFRGSFFGQDVNVLSRTSTIGLGAVGSDSSNASRDNSRVSSNSFV